MRHAIRGPLPLLLAAAVLGAGCQGGQPGGENPVRPLPPVIEPVPDQPQPADEGQPGRWEKLDGVQPAARAFVVAPEGRSGPLPGVVLVPSQWGVNPDVRELARRLAGDGLVVVVPDMYDGVIATSRLSARELTAGVAAARAGELLAGAVAHLRRHPLVGERPVGAVGLGPGGRWLASWAAPDARLGAIAFDSTALDGDQWARVAALRAPALLLVGKENSALDAARREEYRRAAGGALEVSEIEGAGNDLLDPRVQGFQEAARDRAVLVLRDFLLRNLAE
ncbi:MAG: dienelactone hydrolase family protein [Acidobacteria bacterium]|nr:dienelactone hydrolase family protein [Acidobacteriota bacterium]